MPCAWQHASPSDIVSCWDQWSVGARELHFWVLGGGRVDVPLQCPTGLTLLSAQPPRSLGWPSDVWLQPRGVSSEWATRKRSGSSLEEEDSNLTKKQTRADSDRSPESVCTRPSARRPHPPGELSSRPCKVPRLTCPVVGDAAAKRRRTAVADDNRLALAIEKDVAASVVVALAMGTSTKGQVVGAFPAKRVTEEVHNAAGSISDAAQIAAKRLHTAGSVAELLEAYRALPLSSCGSCLNRHLTAHRGQRSSHRQQR